MPLFKQNEKSPLLGSGKFTSSVESDYHTVTRQNVEYIERKHRESTCIDVDVVVLKKHLTLAHAVSYIIGGVAGSGIFVSPTGVTLNVGSVGSSLIIWAVAGVFNLLLALCYAELGTALPLAGGDYSYLYKILGPLPGFLCLWTTVLLIGPCSGAVMARTVGEYLFQLFDVECNTELIVLSSILIVAAFAYLNSTNVKWTARLLNFFSIAKLIALAVIIGTGLVFLGKGHTQNFENAFEGSITDPAKIVAGFVPGFVAYCGWDSVMTLAEEMKNPGRDLPLSVSISMVTVTIIYVLTILAFFTVLSPEEFVASNAVGTSFAMRTLPSVPWIIPIFVALSAFGSVNGLFLSYPRYTFAGAQEGQLPGMFALISFKYFTPIPAIIFMLLLTIFFCAATFFDLQALLLMLGVIMQIKFALALVALLYLKFKRPDIPRTISIHPIIVVFCLACLLAIVGLAVYQDPFTNGFGCAVFILGIPMYFLGKLAKRSSGINVAMDALTTITQQALIVVPSKKEF